jgi:excisionase family DNA binding protein
MCDMLMIDVKEAGRRLGLGRSTTYSLIQRGVLRSVRVGGARRVLVSDLEEFVLRLKEDTDDSD